MMYDMPNITDRNDALHALVYSKTKSITEAEANTIEAVIDLSLIHI